MAEVGTPPEGAVPMPVSTGRAKRLEGKVILVTVSYVIQRSAAPSADATALRRARHKAAARPSRWRAPTKAPRA